MSVSSARINSLKVLIAGTPISRNSRYTAIIHELNEVLDSRRIPKQQRRWLLHMLHSTRFLDSSSRSIVEYLRCVPSRPSMGSYLVQLAQRRKISGSERGQYQRNIVNIRNNYMHAAGAMTMVGHTPATMNGLVRSTLFSGDGIANGQISLFLFVSLSQASAR